MRQRLASLVASLGSSTSQAAVREWATTSGGGLASSGARALLHTSSSAASESSSSGSNPRTYTQYSVYKGKSAMSFKTIVPQFRPVVSSSGNVSYVVEREGAVLLEAAPVSASAAPGPQTLRSYDWSNKLTFALSPLELAQLTDVDNLPDISKGVELFHDPNKGASNKAGAVRTSKKLRLSYNPQGGGYLLTLNQTKEGSPATTVMVPVSRAEFVVLKHLASYLVPRLMGFDMLFEGAGVAPMNLAPAPEAAEASG